MASRIYEWLDSRLKLASLEKTLLDEPIPGGASWIYVFGSATLFLFLLQALTGMFLTVYYTPSPDHAYDSVQFIEQQVTFGWFVRGLHHWGASGMVIAIGLHMLQVFLYGAFKPPREMMWMVGVVLFLLVMAFAFTGYLLPWDQTAYWATQVGINMVGTVPLVGEFLVRVMRGGETLGALTLSRFFAVHVLFLPALIGLGIVVHLFILRRVGPAGPWDERKAAAAREPFYPRQVFMDAVVMVGVFLVLVLLARFVPFPLADKANPADTSFVPVPEWYFLFYYELLKYVHGPLEPLATWVLPAVVILRDVALAVSRLAKKCPGSGLAPCGDGHRRLVSRYCLFPPGHLLEKPLRDEANRSGDCARSDAVYESRLLPAVIGSMAMEERSDRICLTKGTHGPDREWHIKHFRDPQSVSPGSIMPKFPLTEAELQDLTSYMLSLKRTT